MKGHRKTFDDATLVDAICLIEEGNLTITEICLKLHTTFPTLKRSVDLYLKSIAADEDGKDGIEIDWVKAHKIKRSIDKRKKNTRIVYECQLCSNESTIEVSSCSKCGSGCMIRKELRNKISSSELKAIKMTGRRKKKA